MSQYAEQTQIQLSELEASHERMKILTATMDKIQHHRKRDRDCLDQEINKLFNVNHGMKPQPQGHVMDNLYHQDDIKPDAILMNNTSYPSQYQDVDNMSYSEKEALKQLPEASS
ncbi:hypothetical protein O181_108867 [Austropuccinia psidii MF-1]|uniref:Uncharacterized protein n=1 Tax=Austropuccinia psidii MF-1 TaxID=1389203 RepID=A0A9Q3PQU5_9BASI|nr:hypothetical protein [Austropuccinia psidii MF-1]